MIRVLIICVGCDLGPYLQYDFRSTAAISDKYGPDYAYFQQMIAYDRYDKFISGNDTCLICTNAFINDPIGTQKQLLHCGHLYHKTCLENNENHVWNDIGVYNYPYGKCPHCNKTYHSRFEKYKFNPHYRETVSHWHPDYDYYGKDFIQKHVWESYEERWKKRFKQTSKNWSKQYHWGPPLPQDCTLCCHRMN
eukprot:253611_1